MCLNIPNNSNVITIAPYYYNGEIHANASKSYLQRALAISLLTPGYTTILNCDKSKDVIAAKNVISILGATIKGTDILTINSNHSSVGDNITLNVSESGLLLRLFSVISTIFNKNITLTGEGTLLKRPVEPIITSLTKAGAKVESRNWTLPIKITEGISKKNIRLDGSFSSQIISGFLICLPFLQQKTIIEVTNLASKPYVDMTIDIMKCFGVIVTNDNYRRFYLANNQSYKPTIYLAEGDWSGAANHLVGAAISGKIKVSGLNIESKQADKAILDALILFGALVEIDDQTISVSERHKKPFIFNVSDCPDIFPLLTLLASAATGCSELFGIERLRHKESDRLLSVIDIFTKMGVLIELKSNSIVIKGTGTLKKAQLNSFNDHRIAMVSAVATCIADGEISIINWNSVEKSYPDFFKVLNSCTINK